MANRVIITKFTKTSGWGSGPLKPTTTVAVGSASSIKSEITSAIANIGDLTDSENIQIIITHEE